MAHSIFKGTPGGSKTTEISGLFPRAEGAGFARGAVSSAQNPFGFTGDLRDLIAQQRGQQRVGDPNFLQNVQGQLSGALGTPVQQGGITPEQQNILNQIFSQRQSTFENLGIGPSPAAQSAVAASAAPALAQFRQQEVQNRQGDIGQLLQATQLGQGIEFGGRNLDLGLIDKILAAQRLQLGGTQLQTQAGLQAAQLGLPQLGTTSTGGTAAAVDVGLNFDIAAAAGGG